MSKLIRVDCSEAFVGNCDRTRKALGIKTISEFMRMAAIALAISHGIKWGEDGE